MITVEVKFNSIRILFGELIHLRIDATKLLGYQSWREGYGSKKFVIEYTLQGGQIVCEYDAEDKWKEILIGLDKVLDSPNKAIV